MKKLLFTGLLCFTMLSLAQAQYTAERSGYEGDYFSLEGALELFQNSKNLNQFERRLNREDSWVNNLDLNWDGQIDYIRVEHNRQGSFHAIVLQAIISKYEVQDVAVIEIEKVGRYDAVLQIVGDADLYGEEVIVESRRDQNAYASNVSYRGYDNVYYWQPVQYIFAPRYVVYVSPYRWSYYPTWWSPWRQCGWNTYYPRIVNYHNYYHVTNVHRVVNVHNYYYPSRTYCNTVRYRAREVRRTHGHATAYRSTHQRNTKVYKAHPNNAARQVSKPTGRGNGHTAQNFRGKDNNRVSQAPTRNRQPAVSQKPTRSTNGARTSKPNRGNRVSPAPSGQRKPGISKKPTRGTNTASTSRPGNSRKVSPAPSRQSKPSVSKKPTQRSSSARSSSASRGSSSRATSSRQSKPSVSKKPTQRSSSARSSSSSRNSSSRAASSRQSKPSVSKKPTQRSSSARSSSSNRSSSSRVAPKRQSKPAAAKKSTRSAPVKKQAKRGARG